MISLKTGALFGLCFQIGPLLTNCNINEQKKMYKIGVLLGQLFQIQDDYLDLYGGKKVGKQKGLDIIENKKTYLVVVFYEIANKRDVQDFDNSFYSKGDIKKNGSVEKPDYMEKVFVEN